MTMAYDERTIAFYNGEAAPYANRRTAERRPHLDAFIERVGCGARVLELGCGGGQDAEVLIAAGIDVVATDGSAGLAAQASQRIGRSVRVMRFDELDEHDVYDGVWANACLLHVPIAALDGVLARIWRSLKPGGVFVASYKAGAGDGRDMFGRYFNFPSRVELERRYCSAAPWSSVRIEADQGGGYDGVPRTWLLCTASK